MADVWDEKEAHTHTENKAGKVRKGWGKREGDGGRKSKMIKG